MQPLHDIIFIRPDEHQEVTKGGLYIAENWKTLPPTGTIVAAGPDVKLVKEGDRVVFLRYAVVDLNLNDETIRAGKEKHILAVINGES